MRQLPVKAAGDERALTIRLVPGVPHEIDAVADRADPRHRFLRRQWFEAAGGADVATLVASRPDGRIVAALPTGSVGPPAVRLRAVPGCYWPYRSFAVAEDASDAELAALLSSGAARQALGRAWRLGPVYDDDPTAARLVAVAAQGGWTAIQRSVSTSFRLPIATEGWPRGSTLRKNRWFEKELAKAGPLEWRFIRGAEWSPAIFDTLAAIEAKSWIPRQTDGGDAKFLSPRHRRFWEAAAADPAIAGMMHAAILSIGGEPAAFAFDLDVGTLRYCIANSYDERFAKNSPGRVLAYRSLAEALARGIDRTDWGAGDRGGYKTMMGAEPGPAIVDLLFVRNAALAWLLRPFWVRSGRRPRNARLR